MRSFLAHAGKEAIKIRIKGSLGFAGALLPWVLFWPIGCASPTRADTVYFQIEFSSGATQTYALSKSGTFASGLEALTALIYSIGGASQRFDEPYSSSQPIQGNWVQWWNWDFNNNDKREGTLTPALTGLSLNGQTDGDWVSNYWALYTRASSEQGFLFAETGLADLVPSHQTWLALNFSGFSDNSGPQADGPAPTAVMFSPPADQNPPRVISYRQISLSQLEIVFSTVPGGTYQLESSIDLNSPLWLTDLQPFIATSEATDFTVSIQPAYPKKFFRLARILP